MRLLRPVLAALLLVGLTSPALAGDPFADVRELIDAGKLDDAMLIVSIGAVSVNQQDDHGYTLLHYAAQKGSIEAVQALLTRGGDPGIKAKDGRTPAAMTDRPDILDALAAATQQAPATPSP